MKEDDCPLVSMELKAVNAVTQDIENKLVITCKKLRP